MSYGTIQSAINEDIICPPNMVRAINTEYGL